MGDVVELPKRRGKKPPPPSPRPPQGRMALVMDLPANLDAGVVIADLRDAAMRSVLAEVVLVLGSVRAAQVVEAKPGHYVVALPKQGTAEADALLDRCGRAVYESQPWPTLNGKPPVAWTDLPVQNVKFYVLFKSVASACLAAAGQFLEDWQKEDSRG